jgi:uncharacterized protein with PIN domain
VVVLSCDLWLARVAETTLRHDETVLNRHVSTDQELKMSADPWSRPTLEDLKLVLESIGKTDGDHERAAERLDLSVPAEVITARGSTIPAMTREISRFGIGLLHRGSLQLGDVTVKMASDTRDYKYLVRLEWCTPCENGMFISGGQFLGKLDE